MRLPIAPPAPPSTRRPLRPATHKGLPIAKLMSLTAELDDAFPDGQLTPEGIEDFAQDQGGVPRAMVYAAAATNDGMSFVEQADVTFICCAGGCQEWGALDRVEQLLRLREQRLDAGAPAFDVHARVCLKRCEHAPVIEVRTPDGTAVIAEASEASVAEAVELALG